jgi:hypothetical protein
LRLLPDVALVAVADPLPASRAAAAGVARRAPTARSPRCSRRAARRRARRVAAVDASGAWRGDRRRRRRVMEKPLV